MSPRRQDEGSGAEARSEAVRKLEAKEAEQNAATGKSGKPVHSVGRTIHEGRTGGA